MYLKRNPFCHFCGQKDIPIRKPSLVNYPVGIAFYFTLPCRYPHFFYFSLTAYFFDRKPCDIQANMSSLQLSSLSSGRQLPALATSIPIPRMGRNEASPSRMFAKTGARSSQFETLTISPASNPNCQKRSSTSRLKVVPSAMCQSPPLRPVSSVSNSKPVRSRFVSGISNHLTNRTARPLEDGAKQLADCKSRFILIDWQLLG